jgi:hypothetical protein
MDDKYNCRFSDCPHKTPEPTKPHWTDALPKATDKYEAIINSASTLNEDGTETEYYNRERDGHKELSGLLPKLPEENNSDWDTLMQTYNSEQQLKIEDVMYGMHRLILKLQEENADLLKRLEGHLPVHNY